MKKISAYFRSMSIIKLTILVALCANTQEVRYTVTDLGSLGGSIVLAFAINDSGQVAGYAYTANGKLHAFIWQDGSLQDLGTLGGENSIATGINNSGQVIGKAQMADSTWVAFLWQNGSMQNLGTFGGSLDDGEMLIRINDSSMVAGTMLNDDRGFHAFLWQNGNVQLLGTLGGDESSANGINNAGQIVGSSRTADGSLFPFLWQDGNMQNLGSLAGLDGGLAAGINNQGQVVGRSHGLGIARAFLWENGSMQGLGTLGGSNESAMGINDSTQIVGVSAGSAGGSNAFLWEDGEMKNLNDLMDPESGWVLRVAFAINNKGQIVGHGQLNGQVRGFLLTPIEDTECPVFNPDIDFTNQFQFMKLSRLADSPCSLVWINPGGGTFESSSNWEDNKDPKENRCDVVFNTGSSSDYTVTFSDNYWSHSLIVGNDLVRFDNNGRTFFAEPHLSLPAIKIGMVPGESGSLIITNGMLKTGEGFSSIGNNGGIGSLIISTGGSVQIPSDFGCVATLHIGHTSGSSGSLLIENGGNLLTSWITVVGSEHETNGEVFIQGADSKWDAALTVLGEKGTGSMTISDGGQAEMVTTTLGNSTGSTGGIIVTGTNSKLIFPVEEGSLTVGKYGNGEVYIEEGAEVSQAEGSSLHIGTHPGSYGHVAIRGNNTHWDSQGILGVAGEGEGVFIVENGAVASYSALEMAMAPASTGLVRVAGNGSRLSLEFEDVNNHISRSGAGKVSVLEGGMFLVAANLIVGGDPGSQSAGLGILEVKDAGSKSEIIGALAIGDRSRGAVSVLDGAELSAEEVWVGFLDGQDKYTSSMEISGNGSWTSTKNIYVGGGTGTLSIIERGRLDAQRMVIAKDDDSQGNVLVNGDGSSLYATTIHVSPGGQGSLRVKNGGYVRTELITIYPGGIVDSTGGNIEADEIMIGGPTPSLNKIMQRSLIAVDTLLIGYNAALNVRSIHINPSGYLGGTWIYPFDLTNSGTINPGDSIGLPGTFTVSASYTQTSSGMLDIEISGVSEGNYDVLSVGETAHLGGTLRLILLEEYQLNIGDTFEIVRAGAVVNAFEHIIVPDGLHVELQYTPTSVIFTIKEIVHVLDSGKDIPEAYKLSQNYPNPFNPSTLIRFDLPEDGHVRLAVYDILGREVMMLVNDWYPAGSHTVEFDASRLPSGVYLYRLEAGGFTGTKRMVLLQ
jgi:probable HAF family extracellular repeat protein/T5SS/PEP-CTERM-associated repeat protein